jgi:signal transduction histidine kinase
MSATDFTQTPTQQHEARRLETLQDYRVLDSPKEEVFDNIARLACKVFNTPIALVSLIDRERQWFKTHIGLSTRETPREFAFCEYAIRADATLVVQDATLDERFKSNPLVTGDPHIRFYCGVPLRAMNGANLGTLCVIDRTPRELTTAELSTLEMLGRQVELELEIRRRLELVNEALQSSREQRQQSELLAAMVVHDFRNPLGAITLLGSMLQVEEASRSMFEDVMSEVERLRRMVTDVLDIYLDGFGRLTPRWDEVSIARVVHVVTGRLSKLAEHRDQTLVVQMPERALRVRADRQLLERVLENLVANAMQHGPSKQSITLVVQLVDPTMLCIEVCDEGEPIPEAIRTQMFDPFASGAGVQEPASRNFGLGLSFCRIALRALGTTLGVRSLPAGNSFFFEMPALPELPMTDAALDD